MEASSFPQKQNFAKAPHPPRVPYFGNMFNMSRNKPMANFRRLIETYGEGKGIMELFFPAKSIFMVYSHQLSQECQDETRFRKIIHRGLQELRDIGKDGLFTAALDEPNWQKAHNILIPGLGQRAMKGYYPMMLEIAESLLAKWHNIPEGREFNLTDDMTHLTFDTIGYCGFDFKFHSFASEEAHPFIQAMNTSLGDAMKRLANPPSFNKLRFRSIKRVQKANQTMNNLVDDIIQERVNNPEKYTSKADLMSLMLNATDKESNEKLDLVNIRYQIITFLIAGHETTSGLLSFAFYHLIKDPEVLKKAYLEVDKVLGADTSKKPSYRQVMELKYIQQILSETLRLYPTVPAFSVAAYEDTTLGTGKEKYWVEKNQPISQFLPLLHRDPEIWGNQPDEFNPEHFSPEAVENRPVDAYRPFGNGQRACIGRQFAMMEATLVMGMILQRYKMHLTPNYQLDIIESLTLKPGGLMVSLEKRKDSERTIFESEETKIDVQANIQKHDTPLFVAFGSNMGASEDFALQIAQDGESYGFKSQLKSLDEQVTDIQKEGIQVIVTSTYNGTPPDNAKKFDDWLKQEHPTDTFKGLKYAVFGCGNTQWQNSFQSFPRFVDERLEALGAERIFRRGEADASADFDEDFETWYKAFWHSTVQKLGIETQNLDNKPKSLYQLEWLSEENYQTQVPENQQKLTPFQLIQNKELQSEKSERSTRHIELQLPENVAYQTGDHLGVYPENPDELIEQVCQRFQIKAEQTFKLSSTSSVQTALPLNQNLSVRDVLKYFVELQEIATRKQVQALVTHTECPPEKIRLEDFTKPEIYKKEVQQKGLSVLDLLMAHPASEVNFETFLSLLSPLKPRYFSISSSPLANAKTCSLTVGIIYEKHWSGNGTFQGICTNYLANAENGQPIRAYVRPMEMDFRLPEDLQKPMMMIGAGTGLAPYRGFLQERAALKKQGKNLGKALLFFGCRHPEEDFIYQKELEGFEKEGLVEVLTAFSRQQEQKIYVQDQILNHQEKVWQMLEEGSLIYVCGDASGMAKGVREVFIKVCQSQSKTTQEEAEKWLEDLVKNNRYLEDIWG